jgi:hypothetical protein
MLFQKLTIARIQLDIEAYSLLSYTISFYVIVI